MNRIVLIFIMLFVFIQARSQPLESEKAKSFDAETKIITNNGDTLYGTANSWKIGLQLTLKAQGWEIESGLFRKEQIVKKSSVRMKYADLSFVHIMAKKLFLFQQAPLKI